MTIYEQIDAFTFEVQNLIDRTDDKIANPDYEAFVDEVLKDFVSELNQHIYRYNSEFDLTTHHIIGAIEMIKYEYSICGLMSSDILGMVEMVKLSILEEIHLTFDADDLEELDE